MKRWLLVLAGLMVGMAHAQTVDWNAAYSGCASEAREFDKVGKDAYAPSLGRAPNWRDNRDYFAAELGTSPNEAALRRALAEARSRVGSSDYQRVSDTLSVCGLTAALKQLQSGSTQSAATAPSRPASPPPNTRGNGRNQPDKVAAHCMDDVQSQPGVVRNTCNQQVSMRWCSLSYGPNACGSGNLGWADVPPGGTATVDRDVKVLMIACAAPTRPTDIEYTPGGGFRYNCTQ